MFGLEVTENDLHFTLQIVKMHLPDLLRFSSVQNSYSYFIF